MEYVILIFITPLFNYIGIQLLFNIRQLYSPVHINTKVETFTLKLVNFSISDFIILFPPFVLPDTVMEHWDNQSYS